MDAMPKVYGDVHYTIEKIGEAMMADKVENSRYFDSIMEFKTI